jgi:phosphoribosylformimino-5-aminoimidazole carboxamide ribotide isomerase
MQAFTRSYGFRDAYLADLDAISGAEPHWKMYQELADCGVRLLIDAGITGPQRARQMSQFARHHPWLTGIVVGLESIASPESLSEACQEVGAPTAIFSLDLKHGQPITCVEPWRAWNPLRIAAAAIESGYSRMIVLDLASVGTGHGPTTTAWCRELRTAHAGLEIISGGGVRSAADVQRMLDAGCDRVLVASALHNGSLTIEPGAEPSEEAPRA